MKDIFEEYGFYHVFNRANGNENLFREETNYHFFMTKYFQYIEPVADTFAFCLLKNHFHLLIRIKSVVGNKPGNYNQVDNNQWITRQFSRFFNSYAKAYNKMYGRRGSLFQTNVKRKRVNNPIHLQNLVLYIHNNPVKDGFAKNINDWPYSSWHIFRAKKHGVKNAITRFSEQLNINETLEWFGDDDNFFDLHTKFDSSKINSVFDVRNYGGLR